MTFRILTVLDRRALFPGGWTGLTAVVVHAPHHGAGGGGAGVGAGEGFWGL